ncbi:MAG: FAD-dependent monooxygenase [Alphaproteobacteria bacterium]
MTKNYDVIISGGGLAGQTLGLAVAQYGLSVAIVEYGKIEKTLKPEFDGRAVALSLAPLQFLASLGLWQVLSPYAMPINDIRIVDGDGLRGASPMITHFDYRDIGIKFDKEIHKEKKLYSERDNQPFGVIVENRHLRYALINAIKKQKNITLYEEDSILQKNIDDKKIQATLQTDHILTAPLLVIAEGKMSNLAKSITNFYENNYKDTALVLSIKAERHHNGVAVEFFMPAGPFAMLPLVGNKMNVVWTEKSAMAEKLLKLSPKDFHYQLCQRFTDWLGKIEMIGQVFSYPLVARHAYHYGKDRQIIIADSAHTIHPIAGQGFNLGLKDIMALSDILLTAKHHKQDLGDDMVIKNYERKRFYDNQKMLLATDSLHRLFATSHDMAAAMRRLGLLGFDQLSFLKKKTVRYAMGF